jgi:tRNA pseudouridine55 synthase
VSPGRPTGPARIILIDKPEGPSSFDVVRAVRHLLGVRRVGHGGTLDPFASGLLVLGVGPATRLLDLVLTGRKTYRARVRFGQETDTGDLTGEVIATSGVPTTAEHVRTAAAEFVGTIDQVPPRHSALKIEGRRAYDRARAGEDFEVPSRRVEVDAFELLSFDPPFADLEVRCGAGTYVRSLARDLGRALGGTGHLTALRRTASGALTVDEAVALDAIDEAHAAGELLRSPAELTRTWPSVRLDDDEVRRVRHGEQPPAAWADATGDASRVALLGEAGELVAVAVRRDDGRLRLAVVLPAEVVA